VPPYGRKPETTRGGRQVTLAAVVFVVALAVPYSSQRFQQQIALTLQGSALAPFIAMQERLAEGRARADQIDFLQAELDSVVAVAATQSALADENRELRDLIGLRDRAGPSFLPAALLRPGTQGSESMFLVNVGAEDGVTEGAPVVSARGLVGRILEVRLRSAVGMDWTHPDFRASGMLADGTMSGLVENVRGDFREEDRLMLNGTAYHETAPRDALVVTSGLGGVIPRGIPIGRIDATAEVQGGWRKSYWLRPMVDPASVTHVLVETGAADTDLAELWTQDTVRVEAAQPPRGPLAGATVPAPARTPMRGGAPTPAAAPPATAPVAPRVAPTPPPDTVPTQAGDSAGPPADSVAPPAPDSGPGPAPVPPQTNDSGPAPVPVPIDPVDPQPVRTDSVAPGPTPVPADSVPPTSPG
jgi:rod shape-determining protein MreC